MGKTSRSILLIFLVTFMGCFCKGNSGARCIDSERVALQKIRGSLIDPEGSLASWKGTNCCGWKLVVCDNSTGHVIELHLGNPDSPQFSGDINSSILDLKQLRYLDLNHNNFTGSGFPNFVGLLKNLLYLKISACDLQGEFPSGIRNLSNLQYLDLSGNHFSSRLPDWLFHLKYLTRINLGNNAFFGPIPADFINMTSLALLDLSNNQLNFDDGIPKIKGNLCNLEELNFALNNISGELSEFEDFLSGCVRKSLRKLLLGQNRLTGHIPSWLGEFTNLTTLDLEQNSLSGPIPLSLRNLKSLKELFLSRNNLSGTVPEFFGQLSELENLQFASNALEGTVSEVHLSNLSKLRELKMSYNHLTLSIRSNWTPPFKIVNIGLASCQINSEFPLWLREQHKISELDLSNTNISGGIPPWFLNTSSQIFNLNLSHNHLIGNVPDLSKFSELFFVDLSYNSFSGMLPRFPPSSQFLDFTRNFFSGDINLGEGSYSFFYLSLSWNNISSSIPQDICKMSSVEVLDLSNNSLEGTIPLCLGDLQLVKVIDFGNNNLSGTIPTSIGSMQSLQSLHLNNNSLSGTLPDSLKNCTKLVLIDLSENKFEGELPDWISENFPSLIILNLRSNNFHGNIALRTWNLTYLQVLDLSHNNLSGNIPRSFSNFNALTLSNGTLKPLVDVQINENYRENMVLHVKGQKYEYSKILPLVKMIDLSSNNLFDPIPLELTTLIGLISLKLENNHLSGNIPLNIGDLRNLQTLDLSRNQLSGTIPQSLTSLTYLSFLNLSFNQLSGRIPSGNQIQTLLDPSIYIGNEELCGFPLEKKCIDTETSPVKQTNDRDIDILWLCFGPVAGFIVGFLGLFIILLKESWRNGYYEFFRKLGCNVQEKYNHTISLSSQDSSWPRKF